MGGLRGLVARVLEARRLAGTAALLWSPVAWHVRRSYVALTRDLRQPVPPVPAVEGLRWAPFRDEDTGSLLAIDRELTAAEIVRRRLERETCTLGWMGEALAYYRWETTGPRYRLAYLPKTLEGRDGDVVMALVFTALPFRGRGIALASLAEGLRAAQRRGHDRAITFVAPLNRPSRRVCDRLGFQAVGAVGYWNAGGRRLHFATGEVALGAGDRLTLR